MPSNFLCEFYALVLTFTLKKELKIVCLRLVAYNACNGYGLLRIVL